MSGNKPIFVLWVKPKDGKGTWTKAGAVYDNKYDMGLVVHPGVVLTSELMEKNWLILKPFDEDRDSFKKRGGDIGAPPMDFESPDKKEDEIPF